VGCASSRRISPHRVVTSARDLILPAFIATENSAGETLPSVSVSIFVMFASRREFDALQQIVAVLLGRLEFGDDRRVGGRGRRRRRLSNALPAASATATR